MRELIRLLVKLITFHGADVLAEVEFFDRERAVLNLGGGGSKMRAKSSGNRTRTCDQSVNSRLGR